MKECPASILVGPNLSELHAGSLGLHHFDSHGRRARPASSLRAASGLPARALSEAWNGDPGSLARVRASSGHGPAARLQPRSTSSSGSWMRFVGRTIPRDRFEIQVLDDSTDGTADLAASLAEAWRARGVSVEHVRRGTRAGFKAGALAYGTERSSGDFLLVLDADFVAPPDLIRQLLPPFQDPGVGMVQARWDHLNADESWLTKGQKPLSRRPLLLRAGRSLQERSLLQLQRHGRHVAARVRPHCGGLGRSTH